jgi:hypothetical protein
MERSVRTTCMRIVPAASERGHDFRPVHNAGVRVFDIREALAPKEIAYWVPPTPKKLIDPRPNVALAAKSADVYVTTEGLICTSVWNGGLNVLQYEG